jgi:hypothetical protein
MNSCTLGRYDRESILRRRNSDRVEGGSED